MRKVIFKKVKMKISGKEYASVSVVDDKYLLLCYYMDELSGVELSEKIEELEKIRDGVYDYETDLKLRDSTFGGGYGELDFTETASKGTIYFESDEKDNYHQSFDLDIQELIGYLKDWKTYLEISNQQKEI